ncbi:MAG: hypothetical protein IJ022_07685 [Burkholderiaceae bacterium]|nr:hypothetical protein [Burkholderiaceae bacterium]
MADKTFTNVRFQFKYDSYTNWTTNNPKLKKGEMAIAVIATGEKSDSQEVGSVSIPQVLIKFGNGSSNYNDLPFASARAADVYSWAKQSEEDFKEFLENFIGNEMGIDIDTDTQYKIVKGSNDYTYKLQSKAKDATTWTDVSGSSFTIPEYNDTELRGKINAAQTQITAAFSGTTPVKKAEQDADGNVIKTTYATKDELSGVNTTATNANRLAGEIQSGAVPAGKAAADSAGNNIINTYETKEGVNQKITDAFNDFATKVTDDDVVNSYKELIDYAAEHGAEFTELVGKVNTNATNVQLALNNASSANTKLDGMINGGGAPAKKAEQDVDGNPIKTTYAKNADLAAIAKSGNVKDLVQTTGDQIIFDCGDSTNCGV